MWYVINKEDQDKMLEDQKKQFDQHVKEAARKSEARENFIKSTTCPHCGKHEPIPPWLI